jgi:4-hydroxy-3-methylbut-2-enyl diphosphate reductase
MGIMMAEGLEDISEGTVVIRSHGAPKGVIDEAEKKGLTVVDATCPLVQRLKERVRELAEDGYQVVIVGESDHPEVKAVLSYAPDSCYVVREPESFDPEKLNKKVGLVAQTTQSLDNLRAVASLCICHCREVRTYNTICQATHRRGAEAMDLAKRVDVMIVVGGKNSANTTRLAQAVNQGGTTTYHIESAAELRLLEIPLKVPVGVTAGASTPGWVIDEVVTALRKMD